MARQNIFDNETFFTEYQKLRECEVNANSLFELPTLFSLMPDLNGRKIHANIADYCVERRNDSTWFVEGVQRYHRMFSTIVNTLVDNGLYILKVVEPYPTEELVQKHPEYYDLFHQPDFLFIKAVKHAAM